MPRDLITETRYIDALRLLDRVATVAAEVDEAGQLALGVPGEQRAIPGLAAPRHEED